MVGRWAQRWLECRAGDSCVEARRPSDQEHGAPEIFDEHLGHASVAITMTVYQHVILGLQAHATSTFENAVFGR